MSIYNPRKPKGGGRSAVILHTADGKPLTLWDFNEQFAAAQMIQAQLLLGADREEAEALAAARILELRQAKKWFSKK